MANNLGEDIVKMTRNLDRIVCEETATSDLNINGELLGEFTGVGKIKIAKIDMDGLADYGRNTGYVSGNVSLDWEERTLAYDRGRGFDIDIMDDEEHMMLVTANLMAEFARTKVVPEVDAIRFAQIAANAGKTVGDAMADDQAVLDAVLAAEVDFEDAGNSLSGAVIYCTSAVKNSLRKAMPYRMGQGEAPNMRFDTFDDMRLKVVPSDRFYTKVKLNNGTTSGQTDGGYAKDAKGLGIDFVLMNPKVANAITKHEKLRYFTPDVWQKANAHHWDYRIFHDLIVLDNAKSGIYVHATAAAAE